MNEFDRCPLCFERLERDVIDHLQIEHRRTEAEARAIVVRSLEDTLARDPETKRAGRRGSR